MANSLDVTAPGAGHTAPGRGEAPARRGGSRLLRIDLAPVSNLETDEHLDGSHVLPLLDDDGGHGDGVTGFALETTASPARVVLSDYNLMTPSVDLKAEKEASGAFTGD